MGTDLLLLFFLILLNGVFAMSEIAIVSARRARLLQLADAGSAGARHALDLAAQPTRFLSSVQVGITSIGILNGAIGEGAIATRIREGLEQVPVAAPYAEGLALGLMVVALTYASLILGELVPKRLALTHPEAIASLVSQPMAWLARIGRPVVYVLTASTDTILRLFGVRQSKHPAVTVEEIKILLEQGAEEGIVEQTEHELVTNVLNLDARHVGAVLTPRSDVAYLDVRDSLDVNRAKLREDPYTVLPLCDGGLDHVLGFVRSPKVLEQLLDGRALDLRPLVEPPLFVPETMTLMKLLEQFKRTHLPVALVVDEFGDVVGLVSLADVVSSIVGDLPDEPGEEPMVVRRDDGSWLIDGALDMDGVRRAIDAPDVFAGEAEQHYHTLGGFVMLVLGRVPHTGDVFDKEGYRFEVVDMDGNRIDRVLVARRPPAGSGPARGDRDDA
jgi:putative hemolysin